MNFGRTIYSLGNARRRGFTLIELLVVIALTVVLLTLLIGPMMFGLRSTSQAQTAAAAQDGQRLLMRQVMRDLASAAAVRDTHDHYQNVMILEKSSATATTGTQSLAHMYNSYTDIIPPRTMCQDSQSTTTGVCVETGQTVVTDPTTNQNVVPTTTPLPDTNATTSTNTTVTSYGVTAGVSTPVAPASSFTRYFVGLRFPFNFSFAGTTANPGTAVAQPYNNKYDNAMEQSSGDPYYTNTANYAAGTLSGNTNVVDNNLNNTYVLYVANVSPYQAHSSLVNTGLFNTYTGTASTTGNPSGTPILDDPDFFRIVTGNDYLPETDPNYNATTAKRYGDVTTWYQAAGDACTTYAQEHNIRVYNWYKVSRQIMAAREYDLLGYARVGGNIDWDQPQATYTANSNTYNVIDPLSGAAYTGYVGKVSNATTVGTNDIAYDTLHLVNGNATVQVRSQTTILPSGSTGTGGVTLAPDDTSQGAQQASNADPTQQYIPTSYTLGSGQVQGTPVISVSADSPALGAPTTYVTGVANAASIGTALVNTSATIASGDLVEYIGSDTGTAVWDITQSRAVSGATQYVAMTFNRTAAKMSFSVPAIPPVAGSASSYTLGGNADPSNVVNSVNYNTWWYTTLDPTNTLFGANQTEYDKVNGDLVVVLDDPVQFPGNPFTGVTPALRVVVNSERVRGPDRSRAATSVTGATAISLPLITYTRVPFGATVGPNQYSIEYRHASVGSGGAITYHPVIHLGDYSSWGVSSGFISTGKSAAILGTTLAAANTLMVSYNVQNNVLTQGNAIQAHYNVMYPATVTASYATSSLMEVTLGVRVYDPFSGTATTLSTSNDVPVGNGSR